MIIQRRRGTTSTVTTMIAGGVDNNTPFDKCLCSFPR